MSDFMEFNGKFIKTIVKINKYLQEHEIQNSTRDSENQVG